MSLMWLLCLSLTGVCAQQPTLYIAQLLATDIDQRAAVDAALLDIEAKLPGAPQLNARIKLIGRDLDTGCAERSALVAGTKILRPSCTPSQSDEGVDRVAAIVGPTCSSAAGALLPLFEPEKLVMVSPSATRVGFSDTKKYPFFLRSVPSDASRVTGTLLFLQHSGYNRRFALLFSDDSFSKGNANELRKQAVGMNETTIDPYEFRSAQATKTVIRGTPLDDSKADKKTITGHLQAIKASGVNVVVIAAKPYDSLLVLEICDQPDSLLTLPCGKGNVWISLADDLQNSPVFTHSQATKRVTRRQLHGWIFPNPVDSTPTAFKNRWKPDGDLNALYNGGYTFWISFCYDAVFAIAFAAAAVETKFGKNVFQNATLQALRGNLSLELRQSHFVGVSGLTVQGSASINDLTKSRIAMFNLDLREDKCSALNPSSSAPYMGSACEQQVFVIDLETKRVTQVARPVWPGCQSEACDPPAIKGCRPGHFYSSDEERLNCIRCQRNTFQDDFDQGVCKPCADNRATQSTGATSATACECERSTFAMNGSSTDSKAAEPCAPCPVNGICPGKDALPGCEPGFFRVKSEEGGSFVMLRCRQFSDGTEAVSFCSGGSNCSCSPQHKGIMCQACQPGSVVSATGRCLVCADDDIEWAVVLAILVLCLAAAVYGMAVYNMSKPRMGVTLSFATDYMQMTTIAQGLRLGNLKGLGFLFSFSKAGSLNIGSLMSLHPMQCLLPDLDFAGITAITISIPVSIAVLSCAFNIISLTARHVLKRRSERKSQGQTSAFPWVIFKRHCVHSAICSGQLMFAPLFQHSLTLFHFSKIGGEKRLWTIPDVAIDDPQRAAWMPAAISGLVISTFVPVCLSTVLVWGFFVKGKRWMFEGEKGFWLFGALYGHAKMGFGASSWILVRFIRQALASVIVSAGIMNNSVRAVLFLLLLACYSGLLSWRGPYDKFFRNYDGSTSGKTKPAGVRYKHVEIVLVLGQSFTVGCQLCAEMTTADNNIRPWLESLAICCNVLVFLFLAYNFVCDRLYERVMLKERAQWAQKWLRKVGLVALFQDLARSETTERHSLQRHSSNANRQGMEMVNFPEFEAPAAGLTDAELRGRGLEEFFPAE